MDGLWSYIYLSDADQARTLNWPKLKRVLQYSKPFWPRIVVSLVFLVAARVVALIPPMITKKFLDDALPQQSYQLVTLLALAMFITPLIDSALGHVSSFVTAGIAIDLISTLRQQMYDHFQKMSIRFFVNTKKGEVISRLTQDVFNAESAITGPLIESFGDVIAVITTIAAMLSISFPLTVVSVLLFPLFYFPTKRLAMKVRLVTHETMDSGSAMNSFATETLDVNGITLTKLFGLQKKNSQTFAQRMQERKTAQQRSRMMQMIFNSVSAVLLAAGSALVYWYGGRAVVLGTMTAGTLISFTAYVRLLYRPISSLISTYFQLTKSLASFERVFEVLDLPLEVEDPFRAVRPHGDDVGSISFENVWFSYFEVPEQMQQAGEVVIDINEMQRLSTTKRLRGGGRDLTASGKAVGDHLISQTGSDRHWALQDVSFRLRPGMLCAVVGRSGAGKSSLISLIPRLNDVSRGRLTIGGEDVRNISLDALCQIVGVVPQDCFLFNDTIEANLLLANPSATREDMIEACRVANILETINTFPEGFETVVGEKGHRLSGGEKQRIAIARVVLKDPRILILDEATSSLDSVSEQLIQEALVPLMKNRTCVVIAHRLSTILAADHILVLDQGQLVEQGTHKQLLERDGVYAQLYHTQFKAQQEQLAQLAADSP